MGESTRVSAVTLQEMIRDMVARSGLSAAEISRRIGRSSGYLGVMLHNETMPGADLLTDIAACCGYYVVVTDGDSGYFLVPDNLPSDEVSRILDTEASAIGEGVVPDRAFAVPIDSEILDVVFGDSDMEGPEP